MSTPKTSFRTRLFYSYSHKDTKARRAMEKHLSHLEQEDVLVSWSDEKIVAGEHLSEEIKTEMDRTDIFVFLMSPDFIESKPCRMEWDYAKSLSKKEKLRFRVPVIVRDCAWGAFLGEDDIKVLPKDGQAVSRFGKADQAWVQVHDGIQGVVNKIRSTFTPKKEFLEDMDRTDFVSHGHIRLRDIFVFPRLTYASDRAAGDPERRISSEEDLLCKAPVLVHGDEWSGKTALGRSLFLSLAEKFMPVLHLDLAEMSGKPKEAIFSNAYSCQFSGDYHKWKGLTNKTLIIDNFTKVPYHLGIVSMARKLFDRVIVLLASDVFLSYCRGEKRLSDFLVARIEILTLAQQEELIRKKLEIAHNNGEFPDGEVDRVEKRVNSIIISSKVVPRYPFFVLSVLQTYDGFMPENLSITSYGHCYQALILAHLVKSGISGGDADINACFNFAEELAFARYQHSRDQTEGAFDFESFVARYKDRFVIPESTLSRLRDHDYGIIPKKGEFRVKFMEYFFLARHLSKESPENRKIAIQLCEDSHRSSNFLILMFLIHHARDSEVIEDILIRTMVALDGLDPVTLSPSETKLFREICDSAQENILSPDSVSSRRKKEREEQGSDDADLVVDDRPEVESPHHFVNEMYRILKNNKILGQILRSSYGRLEKARIREIIETIADSGLRLVRILVTEKETIEDIAEYVCARHPKSSPEKVKKILRLLSLLWTLVQIEAIVEKIDFPEIRPLVRRVTVEKNTPAYDLIGYFSRLDSAEKLTKEEKRHLEQLLKKHRDSFMRMALSLRTQHYMNTHKSAMKIEHSVCKLLKIKRVVRLH